MLRKDALVEAVTRLKAAGVDGSAQDARILLAHVLGVSRTELTSSFDTRVSDLDVQNYFDLIHQRCAFQPVAQLVGRREFWGRDFRVSADVLDPRPDTETLIEVALQFGPRDRILDLGVGSGCILLTLLAEWKGATGVGLDQSVAALEVAKKNRRNLGLEKRAMLIESNWFENASGRFDLIVSNPPYISEAEFEGLSPDVRDWEPKAALVPGHTGLESYQMIAACAAEYLNPNGVLLCETGWKQAAKVASLFQRAGFVHVETHRDLNGHDRVVLARVEPEQV